MPEPLAKQYDCRVDITLLATHGLSIRVLSNKTNIIEHLFSQVQSYVVERMFHRSTPFLRKY
ncbi:hypothetical protein K2V59_05595 [Staphylococcus arlettae]|uniref:hypothetical protein n=1 Tax=Staphylococcus arlettae TaxID=29378 RepID=UPI001E61FE45|nr:hypothetical protein [Staphylococcus arlettae]MCD8889008.1 hypothetical protein [Staphylococcus arlettae]